MVPPPLTFTPLAFLSLSPGKSKFIGRMLGRLKRKVADKRLPESRNRDLAFCAQAQKAGKESHKEEKGRETAKACWRTATKSKTRHGQAREADRTTPQNEDAGKDAIAREARPLVETSASFHPPSTLSLSEPQGLGGLSPWSSDA